MQILEARDARVQVQNELLSTYHCPLICFTMNIAGPVKYSPLIRRAFHFGINELETRLSDSEILFRKSECKDTGCQAFYVVNASPLFLKKLCTSIEDDSRLGRLFDMDVLDLDGRKLERSLVNGNPRNCIVCGAPGRACAARRIHSVTELKEVTYTIMKTHFQEEDALRVSALAVESLLDEVATTPKPGLVDKRNSGSHKDMDFHTFVRSANALAPYFLQCARIGQSTQHLSPGETFLKLRQAGLEAETTMFQATNGVNTHKGAIYTLGLLCGAFGRLWTPETPVCQLTALLSCVSSLASSQVEQDFSELVSRSKEPSSLTAGQRLYLQYGITGIRGEVVSGLPSVSKLALPIYQNGLADGLSSNDAGVIALLHLIVHVTDTTLYHRGGADGAAYAAQAAACLLEMKERPSMQQIKELDDAFIGQNLSPGGCADLLAVTYFLHKLYHTF